MPVAPEFQNPPAAPNYPPFVVSSDPFALTTVAAPQAVDGVIRFSVTVVDPNPADLLYTRWVSDYPRFIPAATRLIRDDTNGRRQIAEGTEITYDAVQCTDFAPGPEHTLVVIVSDRKFRPSNQFTSDLRYNLIEDDASTAIMTGWRIINCP